MESMAARKNAGAGGVRRSSEGDDWHGPAGDPWTNRFGMGNQFERMQETNDRLKARDEENQEWLNIVKEIKAACRR